MILRLFLTSLVAVLVTSIIFRSTQIPIKMYGETIARRDGSVFWAVVFLLAIVSAVVSGTILIWTVIP